MPARRHPRLLYWTAALLAAGGLALAAAAALRWYAAGAGPAADPAALEQEAARHARDPEALLRIGERLRRSGERRQAFEVVARAYDLRPDAPVAGAAMVEMLLETEQVSGALALSEALVQRYPGSAEVQALRAESVLRAGRYEEALTGAQAAVRAAPESARAWAALGRAGAANKRFEEAWPAFERAVRLAPDDGGLLADYGAALARRGRSGDAPPRAPGPPARPEDAHAPWRAVGGTGERAGRTGGGALAPAPRRGAGPSRDGASLPVGAAPAPDRRGRRRRRRSPGVPHPGPEHG